jgi:hypothetical protein
MGKIAEQIGNIRRVIRSIKWQVVRREETIALKKIHHMNFPF